MKSVRAFRIRRLRGRHKVTCAYCGEEIPTSEATVDHRVPRALGGSSRRENLTIACEPCNTRKGSTPFVDYLLHGPQPAPDPSRPAGERVPVKAAPAAPVVLRVSLSTVLDPVSAIQQHAVQNKIAPPAYTFEALGNDTTPLFGCVCAYLGVTTTAARRTKREAKAEAAKAAREILLATVARPKGAAPDPTACTAEAAE